MEKTSWSLAEKFLIWAAQSKLAADLMHNPNREPLEAWTVRLRPFGNKKGSEIMYLGWGAGLADAMKMAMANARANNSQILNWAQRTDNEPVGGNRGYGVYPDLPF